VREAGLEPACLSTGDFKSPEYTISPLSHNSIPDRTCTDNILDTLNLAFLLERAFFTRLTRNLGAAKGLEPLRESRMRSLRPYPTIAA